MINKKELLHCDNFKTFFVIGNNIIMIKTTNAPETLQFAVYGGISGMLGLLSIILLFLTTLKCSSGVNNAVGLSIALSILTIHFGLRAKTHEGKLVIILGIAVLILVGLIYAIGIIPCAFS